MEWTKIPTDLLQSRISDKEIIAITKYQLLWAMLERQPSEDICLRYMTSKQLQQALNYTAAIERRVNADIKSVESHRNRQKLFYEKNQQHNKNTDGQYDAQYDGQCDEQTDRADKIRLDKNKERKRKKKPAVVSDDWQPTDETKQKLAGKGIEDIDACVEYFKGQCQAKGIEYVNYDRAILNWNFDINKFKKSRFDKPVSEWTNDDFTAYAVFGGRG